MLHLRRLAGGSSSGGLHSNASRICTLGTSTAAATSGALVSPSTSISSNRRSIIRRHESTTTSSLSKKAAKALSSSKQNSAKPSSAVPLAEPAATSSAADANKDAKTKNNDRDARATTTKKEPKSQQAQTQVEINIPASPQARSETADAPQPQQQPQHHLHLHEFAPRIVVVGVGGAGGNAINNMIARSMTGVDFLALNTDAQHLATTLTDNRLQIGTKLTGGLGCGANPAAGQLAAEESAEQILDFIGDAHMAFVTAGMGGGTGTGAAPVVADLCYDAGILTVGVVTKPFFFEGTHRMRLAEEGLGKLKSVVDTLLVIPNQNLFKLVDDQTSFIDSFKLADDVLLAGVRGVTDLMTSPGLINLDFADVQSVMHGMGNAMLGTGQASGEDRAVRAAEEALLNPLLGDMDISTSKGMLVNITGGADMTLWEVDRAAQKITQVVTDSSANIIFGSAFDSTLDGSIKVSVVATGIDDEEQEDA